MVALAMAVERAEQKPEPARLLVELKRPPPPKATIEFEQPASKETNTITQPESAVKLTPDLKPLASFKDTVAGGDEDLSTSNPVLLPDGTLFVAVLIVESAAPLLHGFEILIDCVDAA